MIAQLRKLVIDGTDVDTIMSQLGISKRTYYRLINRAFEHDCELVQKWDSDQLRIDVALYRARLERLYKFILT